jgi:hypothetical protein
MGQIQPQSDSTGVRPPKPPKEKKLAKEFIPTGVMVGIDAFSIGRSIVEDHLTQQELQVDIDARHYHLTLGYGITEIERITEFSNYTNDGSFWRANLETNFLYNTERKSRLVIGIGYARSKFDDLLISQTEDAFGTTLITSRNSGATARWFELTTGAKIHVWKQFFMGYTMRYKFLKKVNSDQLIPTDIPGFGENRQGDKDIFGFNYYLYWRIPIRKSKPTPPILLDTQ